MMKMYCMDQRWQGATIVFANNLEDAKTMIITHFIGHDFNLNSIESSEIKEYEITHGSVIETLGDNGE